MNKVRYTYDDGQRVLRTCIICGTTGYNSDGNGFVGKFYKTVTNRCIACCRKDSNERGKARTIKMVDIQEMVNQLAQQQNDLSRTVTNNDLQQKIVELQGIINGYQETVSELLAKQAALKQEIKDAKLNAGTYYNLLNSKLNSTQARVN